MTELELMDSQLKKEQALNKELVQVLEAILPDWHEDDEGLHNGLIAGEITWGDIRQIKAALNKAKL